MALLLIPGKDPIGDAVLVRAIRDEIASTPGGAIPFSRFMTQALQHPERGYYRRGKTRAGHGGDFLTSPEVHPAFAGAVARQLAVFAEVAGVVDPLWVEAGAGTGTMSNDVARALAGRARVVAVDTAAHVHEGGAGSQRIRSDGLPFATGSIAGGIYANELLDAFPVDRLRRMPDGWRELAVGLEGDRFAWVEREPTAEALSLVQAAERRGAKPADGQLVEVCPGFEGWLAEASRVIARGFVLLFDYGADTASLFSASRGLAGTLRCFAGHAVHDDPLRFVGTQDITCHVDFGHVVEAAGRHGFQAAEFFDQRRFLEQWGVLDAAAKLIPEAEAGRLRLDEAEINAANLAMLLDPKGLGRVKVLVLAKGINAVVIPGLHASAPQPFSVEDLPRIRLPDPFAGLY